MMSSDQQPTTFINPFSALLHDIENDPAAIRELYHRHRTTGRQASSEKLLASGSVNVDSILAEVIRRGDNADPRNSVTIWTRPSHEVKELVRDVQRRLRELEPAIWLMPEACLHITSMEWFHSVDNQEIHRLVGKIPIDTVRLMTAGPKVPILLDTPMLFFDKNAIAINFLPSLQTYEGYTYLHYRRDLLDAAASVGDPDLAIHMRYATPSAHITIARFTEPLSPRNSMPRWVNALQMLDREAVSPRTDISWKLEGPAIMRAGTVWYGGGFTVNGSTRLD